MLRDYCLSSQEVSDYFVGIRFEEGLPKVVFPHGYSLPESDDDCREEIIHLLNVLQRFSSHREGENNNNKQNDIATIPLTSYQFIIQDFLAHGYYAEIEIKYVQSPRGRISWKRTIQKEQALIDNGSVVYLNFQIKSSQYNSDNLLSLIHRFCVYLSFKRLGWLYLSSSYVPPKPQIPYEPNLFKSILRTAIQGTYNDQKRRLFQSMINILDENSSDNISLENYAIGVNKFDKVWERLIDYTFGEDDKNKYFPHATWHIFKEGKIENKQSSPLQQDTIMKLDNSIYVLDGKYYQFGITYDPSDLPPTDSIQKQITYGKYIAETMKVVPANNVYNAFIMPFSNAEGENYRFASVGTADWEKYSKDTPNYAYVLGLLVDTKWLITNYSKHNVTEMVILSKRIEESLAQYRKQND